MGYIILFLLGLAAGTLAGVIGTGGSLILLPVLVIMFGPKAAVPIMAIASVMANLGRIGAWFREIDRRIFLTYSLGSVPFAVLGARALVSLPPSAADLVLGLFFAAVLVFRRHAGPERRLEARTPVMLAGGAGVGFLTGLVQSTGPLSLAVFAAFGLRLGPLLGTESAASLAIYLAKTAAFGAMGVLTLPMLLQGLFVGSSMLAGAFAGKSIVRRIGERQYGLLLDSTIGVNAVVMLAAAVQEYARQR